MCRPTADNGTPPHSYGASLFQKSSPLWLMITMWNVICKPIWIILDRNVADKICNKTICNSCQIYSLSIATFEDEIGFFNRTMEHWNIAIQKAGVAAIGLYSFFKSCITLGLLAWQVFSSVMAQYYFYVFSNLFQSIAYWLGGKVGNWYKAIHSGESLIYSFYCFCATRYNNNHIKNWRLID